MSRTLLVLGEKNFKLTVPDDARITFGPFSPPTGSSTKPNYGVDNDRLKGTLRIYQGKTKTTENIIGVFTNVRGFRDLSVLDYEEEVAREEGAVIWKSDKDGYKREEKVKRATKFVDPLLPQFTEDENDG